MSIADKKICKDCGIEKDASQFGIATIKHSYGTYQYLNTYCRGCASKRAVENWKKKPKEPPKRILLSEDTKVCKKCGIEKSSQEFGRVKTGRGDRFNRPSRCLQCRAARNTQWHSENPLRTKENRTRWYSENKKHVSRYNKERHAANPTERARRFKEWSADKGAYHCAKANARRAKKMSATPEWLSAIQLAQLQEFYDVAEARRMQTGDDYHVDHIFPLDGKVFCGLHVPWNLQIISAFDNLSKRNRVPKEYAHMFWERP